jgi:glycosyltransferase involved in cell wall biosynthesis
MRIWLLKDGETLPVVPGARKLRTWMLADALLERGHEVVWWSSTFSHLQKQLLYTSDQTIIIRTGFELRLLHAGRYQKNVSFQRYRHHRRLAARFASEARACVLPDVIITAYPQIDLSYEAVRFAREHAIPIWVDVRDYWPDTFASHLAARLPRWSRWLVPPWLVGLGLWRDQLRCRHVMRHADGLVSMADSVLRWGLHKAKRERSLRDGVFYLSYTEPETREPDSEALPESVRRLLTSHPNRRICLFAGAFGGSYDLRTVLEAARMAQTGQRPALAFLLVGAGPSFEQVRVDSQGLDNVLVMGWQNSAELTAILTHAHIGLIPCTRACVDRDALPNKVFEYMAHGLPIVSSLKGELYQWMQEHEIGLHYAAGDASALLSQIAQLLDEPELLAHMRHAAHHLYRESFSQAKIYQAYAQHLEQRLMCASRQIRMSTEGAQ